jgi:hypothetical protein
MAANCIVPDESIYVAVEARRKVGALRPATPVISPPIVPVMPPTKPCAAESGVETESAARVAVALVVRIGDVIAELCSNCGRPSRNVKLTVFGPPVLPSQIIGHR